MDQNKFDAMVAAMDAFIHWRTIGERVCAVSDHYTQVNLVAFIDYLPNDAEIVVVNRLDEEAPYELRYYFQPGKYVMAIVRPTPEAFALARELVGEGFEQNTVPYSSR